MAISISEITSRLDQDTLIRIFDRDRDKMFAGTDVDFAQKCLDIAENTAKLYLSKAFQSISSYDPAIISAIVAIALYEAVKYSPMSSGQQTSLYRQGYLDAIAMFKSMVKDETRPQIMSEGSPSNQHTGDVSGDVTEDGDETNYMSQIRRGDTKSAF